MNNQQSEISARVQFNRIGSSAIALLKDNSTFLSLEIDRILDDFYLHILAVPETAKFFPSEAIKRHAKEMQIRHWKIILAGSYDEEYQRSVQKIGETHNRLGLEPRWYMGGYNFLISNMCEAIALRLPSRWTDREASLRRAQLQSAFVRAAILDMEIALSIYLEAERNERTSALQKVANDLDSSVASIVASVSATANELQKAADSMNTSAEETVAQVAAVESAATLTSINVTGVSATAMKLTSAIAEISQQTQLLYKVAKSSAQTANKTEAQINDLAHAANQIGGIVGIISAIAEQTNMLALNATIEAARAGDSGRGFAIVAQEVKELANQTAKANAEIGTKIAAIQIVAESVAANVALIAQTTNETSTAVTGIAEAVEEQSAATQEIAKNATEASRGVTAFAQSVQAVWQAADNSSAAANKVLASSKMLTREATNLKANMENFQRLGQSYLK